MIKAVFITNIPSPYRVDFFAYLQKHYFTNKTKTAAAWGVKVKTKLLRGSATETCYIQSIGGNFA